MQLCAICFPLVAVSYAGATRAENHKECENCGISNDQMHLATKERLRATDGSLEKKEVKQLDLKLVVKS